MNNINMPRVDWNLVLFVLDEYAKEHSIRGGALDCVIDNINSQLDEQEY